MSAGVLASATAITRDGAREDARRELSRAIYRSRQPSLVQRAIDWIINRWERLTNSVGVSPSGGLGIFALVIIFVVVALVVFRRLGPPRRRLTVPESGLALDSVRASGDLRRDADAFASRGEYAEAVRYRLRALARMLEETGVVEPRAGRTAGELLAEVGSVSPVAAGPLAAAVEVFSDVWYGARAADATSYRVLVEADNALATVRPGATSADRRPAPPVVPA